MRVFIAIDIDEKTRAAIADVQRQLNAKVDIKKGDVKWVEPKNIHLTLKFLGEISKAYWRFSNSKFKTADAAMSLPFS